ncbi:MAG: hypothetical protein IJC46_09115 [Clostridia bacterium]|nr:hypothetical protein [Clostridia bacterium]
MKRIWCILSIICIVLSACTADKETLDESGANKKVWQVLAFDGVVEDGLEHTANPGFLEPEHILRDDPRFPKERTFELEGKTYQTVLEMGLLYVVGEESHLYSRRGMLLYTQGDMMIAALPDTWDIVGFHNKAFGKEELEDKELTEEAVINIARNYMAEKIDDIDAYQAKISRIERGFNLEFYRYINGQKTEDTVGMLVGSDGKVYQYIIRKYRVFEQFKDEINQERTDEAIKRIEAALGENCTLNPDSAIIITGEDAIYLQASYVKDVGNNIGYTLRLFTEY